MPDPLEHTFAPTKYPVPSGYYNHTSGRREPWARCAYCSSHVLWRDGVALPVCDCGKTTATESGNIEVNRER